MEVYQDHLRKLDKFVEEANLTGERKIELYHIARSLFEDGGIMLCSAFVDAELSGEYRQSRETRRILERGVELVQEKAREMMEITDKIR